jgi:dTDP-4-dehydrorhamnose reductase
MSYLVVGAAGQLGGAIVQRFGAEGEVIGWTRRELDVADHRAVIDRIGRVRPDVIVNCTAYNNVDGAEDDPLAALDVNAFGVRSLARAAAGVGATLVHYSTDFVFDGAGSEPYTEEDSPNPRSVYGSSKLIGEWFARAVPRHYVLRVESLFGGEAARSSIDKIIDALQHDRQAPVFTDRTVSPSYVDDVAEATWALLNRGAPEGLYHCVNSGATTWFDLGREIARLLGRPARLMPVSVHDVKLRAQRPIWCVLSNAKLARAGVPMPSWQDALKRYLGRVVADRHLSMRSD